MTPGRVRHLVDQEARACGFDDVGIAPPSLPGEEEGLRRWLEAGYHAQMDWIERTAEVRLDLRLRFEWARSVVVLVRAYRPSLPPPPQGGLASLVSSYARGRDYHDVLTPKVQELGNRLEAALSPRPVRRHAYVDTGPALERQLAREAGLGWLGKNGLLLRRRGRGSWAFLGLLVTDLELEPGPIEAPWPAGGPSPVGSCGGCEACQPACPTAAFVRPGVVDSARCISYLTIEHEGPIDRSLRRAMGGWLFGCDLCQTACPFDRPREGAADFTAAGSALTGLDLPALLELDEEGFRRRFRATPLWRPRREGILRNALIVAANLERHDCAAAAASLLADPSSVLREAASWCLAELGDRAHLAALQQAVPKEQDPAVRRLMAQDLIRLAGAAPPLA